MISINQKYLNFFKVLVYQVLRIFYFLGLAIFVAGMTFFIALFIKNPNWLEIDSCLDNGGVWDGEQKLCRDDCLKWTTDLGCIKLNEDQVKIFKTCWHNSNCPSEKVYQEVCLNNQKAWNLNNKECYFEFMPQDCNELKGEWLYPSTCE